MKRSVFGVGVMDATDTVQKFENGKRVWVCPYYDVWYSMMRRCYSVVLHKSRPTYIGCSVDERWHRYSDFREWMESKQWEGKSLDKDLLSFGNKVYGPDTCVFITKGVNTFITDLKVSKGGYLPGVTYRVRDHYDPVYVATLTWKGKSVHIGHYETEVDAHRAWLIKKRELASIIAGEQDDHVVAAAIIERYKEERYL